MFSFWRFQRNVLCNLTQQDQTVIPCNGHLLMTTLSGMKLKRSVHTIFTNKHMDSFDMWFKLIGLPTLVRTIKQNDCGPKAPLSPLRLVFTDVNQVFLSKNITLSHWI